MIQKRARVSVNLLAVTGKIKRAFYPCSEFAALLISVFSTTCNVPCTPPFIKQTQDHHLVYKRPTIIFHMQKRDARYSRNVYACIEEKKLKIRSIQLLHIHVAVMLQLLQELHNHRYTPADVPIDNPISLGPAAVPNLL